MSDGRTRVGRGSDGGVAGTRGGARSLRRCARGVLPCVLLLVGCAAASACGTPVDAHVLRSCLAADTCGMCMGTRPHGVTCGWCQIAGAGHCIPAGAGNETPPACAGGHWLVNATATQCPAVPPPVCAGASDPNR